MHKRIQIKNAIIVNEGRQFVGSLLIDNNQIGQILEGKDAVPDEPPMEVVNADACFQASLMSTYIAAIQV